MTIGQEQSVTGTITPAGFPHGAPIEEAVVDHMRYSGQLPQERLPHGVTIRPAQQSKVAISVGWRNYRDHEIACDPDSRLMFFDILGSVPEGRNPLDWRDVAESAIERLNEVAAKLKKLLAENPRPAVAFGEKYDQCTIDGQKVEG